MLDCACVTSASVGPWRSLSSAACAWATLCCATVTSFGLTVVSFWRLAWAWVKLAWACARSVCVGPAWSAARSFCAIWTLASCWFTCARAPWQLESSSGFLARPQIESRLDWAAHRAFLACSTFCWALARVCSVAPAFTLSRFAWAEVMLAWADATSPVVADPCRAFASWAWAATRRAWASARSAWVGPTYRAFRAALALSTLAWAAAMSVSVAPCLACSSFSLALSRLACAVVTASSRSVVWSWSKG